MADLKYYDVILKPIVTEKSMNFMSDKKYAFSVHPDATKNQIKEAVAKFEALVREQLARNEKIKAQKEFVDFDNLDKIVIISAYQFNFFISICFFIYFVTTEEINATDSFLSSLT